MTHWRDRFTVVPAVYILLCRGDKVLLLRRAHTGYRDGEYGLPSGHFEGRESAVQAAVRETKEEVGVDVKPEDLRLVYTQHRVGEGDYHERLQLFFESKKWHGEPSNAEPDKCDEIRWCKLSALPTNLVPELHYFFEGLAAKQPYGDVGF